MTVCAHDRRPIFGRFIAETLVRNEPGRIIAEEWARTANIRPEIDTDAFVIMPDHVHGILWINKNLVHPSPTVGVLPEHVGAYGNTPALHSPSRTIGAAVRAFKAAATRRIRELAGQRDLIVWQRNYYERVIRDDRELNALRDYIATNPLRQVLKC